MQPQYADNESKNIFYDTLPGDTATINQVYGYDMICLFNMNGSITHATGDGYHIMGLTANELLLMNVFDLFDIGKNHFGGSSYKPFRLTSSKQYYDTALEFEHIIMPTVNGEEFFCLTKCVDDNAQLKERDDKIRELTKKIEELEERDRYKNKILSVVTHDLKSPVASISALARMMEGGEIESDLRCAIHEAKEQLESSNELITNLLDWASNAFKSENTAKTGIDLSEVIYSCIAVLRSSADEKQIKIASNISEPLYASAIPNHANIIIRNLLQNAIKFTHPGGSISITGKIVNGRVLTVITDNGVGMTEEKIVGVLNGAPLSSPGTQGEKGSGIGLWLCREFASVNNGTIIISSEVNKGTSITVSLPTC